ncbi:pilus assembly protein Flp/PilA [Cereibacter ovatus]|uniref:Pilus assembly protein Flp/PilA n=1 Tax=Cereibacter ovatus TaxID=439529 RepID=A0A285CSV1_9RHOB|nr:Flp family type IVb pilin [Cereibacter ovatus]SNX70612.1 pilus assembly protein Flp/PilA [Cereibacter ovatus]
MFKFLSSKLRSFRRDEEGVTLVEYGIAIILAVVVGGAALTTLGTSVSTQMGQATTILDNN